MTKREKKKRKNYYFVLLIFFTIGMFCLSYFPKSKNFSNHFDFFQVIDNFFENKNKQMKEYHTCLNQSYNESELTQELISKKNEIDFLIAVNKYNVSVYYEDINTGFNYRYQENKVYYGCSLIKLVDALYLIDKATLGEIDLDRETVTYEAKYKMGYSSGMINHKYGEKISLRTLLTYAVSMSDNSAHLMLLDYIGFNNLKQYGENLGSKVILTGGDKFGNQTAKDTNIYLKKAYQIITQNKEYGEFLKNIMDNNDRNDFNTDSIKIYHKYGSYENNYHDIGLSLENNPYAISIFTLHEYSNHQEVIQNIHSKIRELHDLFIEYRQEKCQEEIYGK